MITLLLSAISLAATPGAPVPTPTPTPVPCGSCVESSFLPGRPGKSWGPLAAGAFAGAVIGRIEAQAQPLSDAPGLKMRISGKPLVFFGAAGAAFLVKTFTHGLEEPPLVAAPFIHLPPPPELDDVVRTKIAQSFPLSARRRMDRLSYVTLGHLIGQPLGFMFSGRNRTRRATDVLVPYEAALVTGAIVGQVKHIAHRARPFAYYCDPSSKGALEQADAQLSFFSGHAALAFALASATVETAKYRGVRHPRRMAWASYGIAGATGLLRVGADKHYLTDVLVGGGVGFLVGRQLARWQRPDGPIPSASSAASTPPVFLTLPVGTGALSATMGDGFSIQFRFAR